MRLIALQVDAFVDDGLIPVVRHTFYGRTQEEAEERFKLHCNADQFLHNCVRQGSHNGLVCHFNSCWHEVKFDPASKRL